MAVLQLTQPCQRTTKEEMWCQQNLCISDTLQLRKHLW